MDFKLNTNKPYLIAEIGGNHQGDFEYAKKLLNKAIESKVDCIKFQIYKGESLVNKNLSKTRFEHFKKFELEKDQHIYLAEKCKEAGIDYNSSIWSIDMLDWVDEYLSFYKIGSGDLTNFLLIKELTKRGKPIFISTGLSNEKEILRTVTFIREQNEVYKKTENLCILQCTSMYPIPLKEANLLCISRFKEKFNCLAGYSDHTIGSEAIYLASLLGAEIIEFHFTDNKNNKTFRDHQVSLTKEDIHELIKRFKNTSDLLGNNIKRPQKSEIENNHLETFRRAVFPKNFIKKGEIIKKESLCTLRPKIGTCASDFFEVVGSVALKDIEPLQVIRKEIDFSKIKNSL